MAKRRHDPDTRQLTGLLCMPCEIKLSNPSKAWLEDQTRGIGRLDKPLRRSNKLLARISSRLDRFRARPKAAQLCKAHHGLNPKLIRRHMLHIIAECTKRIDRLRLWQRRIPFPPSIKAWLQRMDAVIGMWMGAEAFRAVFGYAQVASCPKPVKSGCEACIMDRADAIRRQSETLADTLRAVRLQVWAAKEEHEKEERGKKKRGKKRSKKGEREKEKRKEERNNDTRSSKSSRHPVSRAESVTKKVEQEVIAKNRGLPRQGASGWAQNTDGQLDYAYFQSPPSSWGALDEESNEEHPESDSVQEAQSSDLDELDTPDELAGFEASNWMDMRMKSQGLAPNERQKLFQDDTHPVLSDYGPASAVTSALRPPRAMYSGSESGRRPQPNLNRPAPSAGPSTSMAGGSIWEAVSVASLSESGSHVPSHSTSAMAPPSTMSTISSLAPNLSARRKAPGTQNAPSLVSLPPDDQPYLDFCKAMGLEVRLDLLKNQRAAAPSGLGSQPSDEGGDILPPPSSIYSQD